MIRPQPPADPAPPPPPASGAVKPGYVPTDDRARRIQIGLVGLAGILLMVGLAGMLRDPDAVEPAGAGTAAVAPEGNEPLADPGTSPIAPPAAAPVTTAPEPVAATPGVVTGPATSAVPDLEPESLPERQAPPPRQ